MVEPRTLITDEAELIGSLRRRLEQAESANVSQEIEIKRLRAENAEYRQRLRKLDANWPRSSD